MKYVGFYDHETDNRTMSLAATNKMNYIAETLVSNGENVTIVACGITGKKRAKQYDHNLTDGVQVHYFDTMIPPKSFFSKVYHIIKRFFTIAGYLIINCRKGETIIAYHSLGIMRAISIAKRIKKLKVVLEVEEIYNEVHQYKGALDKEHELKFIKKADAYIFPTQLLNEQLNSDGKPNIIIHGTYKVESQRMSKTEYRKKYGWDENKIHVVYAGTFDPRKGGVAAAAATEYLPANYYIHIIGFGNEYDIKQMQKVIETTDKKSIANVSYDGLLSGEEYIRFIQSCDIGLSTQDPSAAFNSTSFPSKVLSYLANGLRVVSIRIPAIYKSSVRDNLYYYEEQTPKEIAKTIMSINMKNAYDSRSKINELSIVFKKEIGNMLSSL